MQTEGREEIERTIFGDHLSPANLDELIAQSTSIDLGNGQFLFREGEFENHVYLLLEGQVDLTMTVPGRGAVRILSLRTGEIIAWSSILGDGTMTCSAVCTTPSRLLAIDCKAARELTDSNHELGYELMKMLASALAQRLLATRLQLLDLFTSGESTPQKVASRSELQNE